MRALPDARRALAHNPIGANYLVRLGVQCDACASLATINVHGDDTVAFLCTIDLAGMQFSRRRVADMIPQEAGKGAN